MMRLFVLAGGFGTRLQSAVDMVPKALAPVGEVPFLQLQIEAWFSEGVRHFTFLLHHQADQIVTFLQDEGARYGGKCQFDWVIEEVPLDTGGALAHALREVKFEGDFLVINADTWLGTGIRKVATADPPALGVVKLRDTDRYGKVSFDNTFRIVNFCEKSPEGGAGWVSAGLCKLSSEDFRHWVDGRLSLERDVYVSLAREGRLLAVPLDCDFIDIGIPSDYKRFCEWVEEEMIGEL